MPSSIRPYRRFPLQCCITSYGLGHVSVCGLVLMMLALVGCVERKIPPCQGTPFKTPCVGPYTVDAEAGGPTYTQVTAPLAVVIQDKYGKQHCQEITP